MVEFRKAVVQQLTEREYEELYKFCCSHNIAFDKLLAMLLRSIQEGEIDTTVFDYSDFIFSAVKDSSEEEEEIPNSSEIPPEKTENDEELSETWWSLTSGTRTKLPPHSFPKELVNILALIENGFDISLDESSLREVIESESSSTQLKDIADLDEVIDEITPIFDDLIASKEEF
jgi:hypothetical protein